MLKNLENFTPTSQKILNALTPQQRKAAMTLTGPLLVLAGAGTGKTSTIVARVIHMMEEKIKASEILVLTFTNKAAGEMKERVQRQVKTNSPEMTTFHSFCLNFLKEYMEADSKNGRTTKFGIADETTQKTILKEVIPEKYLNKKIDSVNIKVEEFMSVIQNLQNFLIEPSKNATIGRIAINQLLRDLQDQNKNHEWLSDSKFETIELLTDLAKVYYEYKERLKKENLVDFDDLINLSISVLEKNENILKFFRSKIKYIMVDEFQDTNLAQMRLLELLVNPKENNICVVGDEVQSIYGWRGADIDFILSFDKNHKKCKTINLSRNFRSTNLIVSHANSIVDSASEKHDKKIPLSAHSKERGDVKLMKFKSPVAEAGYIAKSIKYELQRGVPASEIVVLYRSRMILSMIENGLIKNRVQYTVHQGRALLKTKIVSEFLGIFHYLINKKNQTALKRGMLAYKAVSESRFNKSKSLLNPSDFLTLSDGRLSDYGLTKKELEKLADFKNFMTLLEVNMNSGISMDEFVLSLSRRSKMMIERDKKLQDTSKLSEAVEKKTWNELNAMKNVIELMKQYDSIPEFIEGISLDVEEEQADTGKVTLMTIHSSKGLEYHSVYLPGFNQGLIPTERSLSSFKLLEEERRIAYVAITRAKRKLFVSSTSFMFGKKYQPSQFIFEAGLNLR